MKLGNLISCKLSNGFRLLCCSYANEYNKKYGRSGSLYRQKTQAKLLEDEPEDYPLICFHYIHQNPVKAGLCAKMEDWEYSSFQDHLGRKKGTIAQKKTAYDLLGIEPKTFYNESFSIIDDEKILKII